MDYCLSQKLPSELVHIICEKTHRMNMKEVLEEIDAKGSFEADDEIGVVFTSIKEAIEELNEITEEEL